MCLMVTEAGASSPAEPEGLLWVQGSSHYSGKVPSWEGFPRTLCPEMEGYAFSAQTRVFPSATGRCTPLPALRLWAR